MTKKKTDYFSYLEDTKKHHGKIAHLAVTGVKKAVSNAKNLNIDVTYLKGNAIIVESPTGDVVRVIETNVDTGRKVQVGTKVKLSKRS
ncbi:MAG: hypothetical protein U0354_05900 [Candidatus Sericytochromatia bacterium]